MNKYRQLRLELLEAIKYDESGITRDVISKQPYTLVTVFINDNGEHGGKEFIGHGFPKVCHPDIFDWHIGVNIATARAVQDAVEKMV